MATTIQNFFAKAQEAEFSRDFLFRVNNIKLTGPSEGSTIEFGGD